MNNDLKNKTVTLCFEINSLLDKYIEVHNGLHNTSWRNIIPIPFIFKRIDFNGLRNRANLITEKLKDSLLEINDLIKKIEDNENFIVLLKTYCIALLKTVSLLEKILNNLYLKGKKSKKYSLKEHLELSEEYDKSVAHYLFIGDELNCRFIKFKENINN